MIPPVDSLQVHYSDRLSEIVNRVNLVQLWLEPVEPDFVGFKQTSTRFKRTEWIVFQCDLLVVNKMWLKQNQIKLCSYAATMTFKFEK